jgi:haloacid dehalogenase-like hydrolase
MRSSSIKLEGGYMADRLTMLIRSYLGLTFLACSSICAFTQTDPLPSWKDTAPKKAIIGFVERVTREGTLDFVPVDQRIATFDNDGTLWVEQTTYVQLAFVLDRVKELAPQHPDWRTTQPFKGVLEGDMSAVAATGEKGLIQLMAATHSGMTVEQFQKTVTEWFATAKHPRFKRPYADCVYQPMVELLSYLRANGFKTYIVSGGGVEFMRPWTEKVYGIPPEQVVGSSIKTKFEMIDGKPALLRLPEINFHRR